MTREILVPSGDRAFKTICVSHLIRNVGLFLQGLKELCHEADCLSPSSAEFKNVWSYTTSSYTPLCRGTDQSQGWLYLYVCNISNTL